MTKRKIRHGSKSERFRRAQERLGRSNAKCLLCIITHPHSLQLHHLAGKDFDDETGPFCNNHHGRLSDAFKDHPEKIPDCTNPLEGTGHYLLGLAECVLIVQEDLGPQHQLHEFLGRLDAKLRTFGHQLIDIARANPHGGAL